MFVQNLLIGFLVLLIVLIAIDPAIAATKHKSKADIEVQKQLDPITQELNTLSAKSAANALFSPDEVSKMLDIKLQLLDLIQTYPTDQLLIKPAYEAARLFKNREMYDDAYDFYNYIQTTFPQTPYGAQSKVAIQRMKQQLGDQYFMDSTPATQTTPATAQH